MVAVLKGSVGRFALMNGHTDTVPNGPADAWEHGPLSADIEAALVRALASDIKAGWRPS